MRIFKTIIIIFIITLSWNCKDKKSENTSTDNNLISNDASSHLEGKKIYTKKCAQCHLPNGEGIPKIYPPLKNSNWLIEKRTASIHAVKFGLSGEIMVNEKPFDNVMSPLNLSDKEVAQVLNYVMNTWGNTQNKKVTEEEVATIKK